MGVHGLWDFLSPVGRRVSVETLAGKRLAIDASIWMVQFMKAMRDERGEMVRNAHLIGFFRRICKLLFLRTKPVFVFDGGTPALKRRTVIARRRQRENAQAKIRKTAEKLLLNHVKAIRLKELADNLQDQKDNSNSIDKNNSKGKEVLLDKFDSLKKNEAVSESHNQEMVDEMLAASIVAEESGALGTASSSAAEISSCIGNASGSTTVFPQEDGDDEDDEEMPITDGNVDPAVLAALPPSMQLDLLVQMRERLMAENRQKYQKVKKAPQNFSELQIEAYLKTVAFRREIDQVQKAAAGKGVSGVQTSRIASESNREFIFSSSFTGDKQLFASGGAAKIPENQQRVEKKDSSFLNAMTSATKSNTKVEPTVNKDVEIFIDEKGHRRVSKSRAMGIRMTRDLQRNIDLMKELEEERTPVDIEANAQVNPDLDGQSGKSNCYGESFEAVNEFNREIVPNSIVKSSLEPKIHKDALKNESYIEISFDDDGELRSLDDDDEFFAHLVAGDQVPICSVDNSTSDCEWEDGVISKESGSLIDGNKLGSDSLHARDENENESDVEWVEGTSAISENFFGAEGSKDKDIGVELQEGHVGDIHEDDRLFTVDIQKIVSKGSAEEEAALQEAIRRSLEESAGGKSSFVSGELKDACNRQLQLKSCSSLPSSHVGSFLNGDKHSQSIFSECDHSSAVAGKDTDASSSLGMPSTPAICVTAGTASHIDTKNIDGQQQNAFLENAQIKNPVKSDSSAPADMAVGLPGTMPENFVDNVANNRASSIYNSVKLNEYSSGQTASVLEEQTLRSDVKETVGKDDTSPVSVQEQTHDAETSAFKDKENTLEPLGSSFEDELLVLGEEYKNLGDEQRKLERNADSVNAEMFVECQELLQMFGLPYIIAPLEAEAQCAYMDLANLVDGVVTDDSDVFLFGAKSVYKNIFDDRKYVETYFMKDIESELGLDREKLIRMALLLGSDYTEGVSGIGIVNAIEVVNAFPEDDGLHKFRDWIESPDPAILGKVGRRPGLSSKKKGSKDSKNGLNNSRSDGEGNSAADSDTLLEHEDDEAKNGIQKTKQNFMNKHRNVSKNWHVPASFPSDAVISAYAAPQVDKSNEAFAWGKPDIFSLRRLCWEKFAWASQKADELLLPVLKEYNKHETQLRLEAFYTFNERFAKIRSKRIQKAVKGIVGKQSLDLDVADGLQEIEVKKEKTEGANGNRRKKSLPRRENDVVGERKNSAKKLKSQQDDGKQKEGLLTEAESTGLCTEAEKQALNDAESFRGRERQRQRQRKTSIKRSWRKVNSDSECDASSISSSDEDEHELLAGNVELPDSVRRSKRVRQAANYLEEDEESDGLMITESVKYSDDGADEQKSSRYPIAQEAEVTNASDDREFKSDDLPEHGSPGNYLEKGGGFCAEEDDVENDSHSTYLQMGGGFCVEDEEDLVFRECDGGGASTMTDADISSTLTVAEEADPTTNPREIVITPACVQDTVQGLRNSPLSDLHLNLGDKHEVTDSNLSNVAVPVNDDAPTTVNPFSAIPYLKRKRRKT